MGPIVCSSTNFIGAASAPARKSKAKSLASYEFDNPVILKLVPKTSCIVALLIIDFSTYDSCNTSLFSSKKVFVFSSINKTPNLLPMLSFVASCMALPPEMSKEMFT